MQTHGETSYHIIEPTLIMTKAHLYRVIQGILPPYLFRALKKFPFYTTLASWVSTLCGTESTPQWNTITTGVLKNKKIFCDPRGPWQHEMITGIYDGFLFDYFSTLDLRGKTVFDIGTHIGFHTLWFAERVGPQGAVHAFEPNPHNIERININIDGNETLKERITLHAKAISDTTGEATFLSSDNIEGGTSSGGFLDASDTIMEKHVYTDEIGFDSYTVEAQSLDALAAEGLVPDLIKLDVEGAEGLVLNGAHTLLTKHRPRIALEVHSILNMFEVLTILRDSDYNITLLNTESDGRCFLIALPQTH